MTSPSVTTTAKDLLHQLRPRRLLLLIGLALATFLLLIALGGGQDAVTALATVQPGWLLVALGVHYSGFILRGTRWQQLLWVMGHRLPWHESMTLLLSGWFASALLPARAGDLVRVGLLRRSTPMRPAVPVAAGLSSILLERVLDLLALLLLGGGFGFALLRTRLPAWITLAYGVGLLGVVGIIALLLAAPPLLLWLRGRWLHPWWQQLLQFASEVIHSLRALGRQPVSAVLVLLASLYIWLCDALLMWLVLRAMTVNAPFASIAFVALTVDIFAAIPVTPGGIGQIEAVNVALLALLPLPPFNIAAAVLVNRAISYWSCLLVSGVVTFTTGVGQFMVPLTKEHEMGRDDESRL